MAETSSPARSVIGVIAALALIVGLGSCGLGGLDYLEDFRVWPAYLPPGVEVEGLCPAENLLVISSLGDARGSEPPTVVIQMISTGQAINHSDIPSELGRSIRDAPPENALTPTEVRRRDGFTWQHIPGYAEHVATGVAWQEGPNLFVVEGVGLDLAEVQLIAEGLEPSFSRWIGCV